MKKIIKSMLVLSLCAICAACCALFAACATDFKSFYNDLDAILEKGHSFGYDYTYDEWDELFKISENVPDTYSVSCKGFSGVKFINLIKVGESSSDCVKHLMFTKFNMTEGKFKIVLTNIDQKQVVSVDDEFTPDEDGLCRDIVLERLNVSGEFWVKLVGVDADFEFELQFVTEQDMNGEIDPPTPPVTESNFVKIKTAYRNAGYEVDIKADSVDATTAQLIKSMQQMYEQLGYGMCFIGKNLNDAMNMELYMLISADSEASANEFAAGLSTYKNKKSGKDVIVSLNIMLSTPNFAPFEQATA